MSATLFDNISFGGRTYDPALDKGRLHRQYTDVFALMSDGQWRTLDEISAATGHPQQSVSARLRDSRKARWGSHTVNRRRRPGVDPRSGVHEYQLVVTSC